MKGTVLFYKKNNGYGFIDQDESQDNIFFHISKCDEVPEPGIRVQYEVVDGRKGPEAVNVKAE